VDIDLAPFSWINPCGYAGLQTTQMRDLLDEAPADLLPRVQQDLQRALAESLL